MNSTRSLVGQIPNRTDKFLLILGFVVFLIALIAINIFGAMTKHDSSIDYIHWLMLLGVVLQVPFAARLPRKGIAILASTLILSGVVCVIGMCVLDFVFWSIPDEDLRGEVARHLIETPSVWQPFMKWGTEEVLFGGLVCASSLYLRISIAGTLFVVGGSICAIAGGGWFNIAGWIAITLGFLLNFNWLRESN